MRSLLLCVVLSASASLFSCGQAPCSPSTCPTGCCSAAGECKGGAEPLACGISGGACNVCLLGQGCVQGQCFSSTGSGGGAATGGGGGSGGGGGGGGGGSTPSIVNLFPNNAYVRSGADLELAAIAEGLASGDVTFILESGSGSLVPTGPNSATFTAYSANVSVRIRAQSTLMSSVSAVANITTGTSGPELRVSPGYVSAAATYRLTPGDRQTFTMTRVVSQNPWAGGVRDVQWTLWPSNTPVQNGTITSVAGMRRLFARDPATNQVESASVTAELTSLNAVVISPAVATVSPGGVVQLTAMVSSGDPVVWGVDTAAGAGTISATGLYTAPMTPGIYIVIAIPNGVISERYALATIIVQ